MLIKHFWQVLCLVSVLVLLAGCGAGTQATPVASSEAATATESSVDTVAPSATVTTLVESPVPSETAVAGGAQVQDAGRIEFQPNTTGWYTNGDLAPDSVIRYELSVQRGQQMNIWLNTEPVSTDSPLAYLVIAGADGKSLLTSPEMYFSAVLETSQDYSVEIHSASKDPLAYTLRVEIPAVAIDPALGGMYDLVDEAVCQNIQQMAAEALDIDFTRQPRAPFLDVIAGEAGQGCRLTATGNGSQFADPQSVVQTLVGSAGLGWTEQPAYQADGPTGAAAGLARDMGLMLINVNWAPEMGMVCPADQPIADCNLTPEQKIYTIQIDIAQYRASFSLDGHWEDAATNFSLDLYQDWKNIYGHHTAVAQGGNKIDSLDVSIDGSLKGNVATVQFSSSFTSDTGTAEITYLDVNTITWKIIDPPDGEYYLPAEATLTRK